VLQANIAFHKESFKIIEVEKAYVATVHIESIPEDLYLCREPIMAGVEVGHIQKMLRGLTTGGFLLEIALLYSDPENMHLNITNIEKKTTIRHILKLLDLPNNEYETNDTIFKRVISIPASDFQKYVKELVSGTKEITITSKCDKLILSSSNEFGGSSIEIQPTPKGLNYHKLEDGEEVITAVYPAKFLERFAKPLDSQVELFFCAEFPLIIRYCMSSTVVKFLLNPIED